MQSSGAVQDRKMIKLQQDLTRSTGTFPIFARVALSSQILGAGRRVAQGDEGAVLAVQIDGHQRVIKRPNFRDAGRLSKYVVFERFAVRRFFSAARSYEVLTLIIVLASRWRDPYHTIYDGYHPKSRASPWCGVLSGAAPPPAAQPHNATNDARRFLVHWCEHRPAS